MSWDPACSFLLKMPVDNLFEATGTPGLERYRCKGCQEVVERRERAAHHARHRGAQTRSEAAAQRRAERARLDNLAKARAAKRPKLAALEAAEATPLLETYDPFRNPGDPVGRLRAVADAPRSTRRTVAAPPPPPPIPGR